jgi:hypothetical protein
MAWLSKVTTEERRNGDGGLFSRMLQMEVSFSAEEFPIDLSAATPDPRLMLALSRVCDTVTLTLNVPPPLDVGPCPEFQTADKIAAPPAPPAPPKVSKIDYSIAMGKEQPNVEEKPTETKPTEIPVCSICGAHLATRFDAKLKKTVPTCLRCGKDRQANGRPIEPAKLKGA